MSQVYWEVRSSCSQMFFKIGVLKNFAILTGKYLCWSLFLIKTPTHLFSYEYCEMLRNNFFEKSTSNGCFFEVNATSFLSVSKEEYKSFYYQAVNNFCKKGGLRMLFSWHQQKICYPGKSRKFVEFFFLFIGLFDNDL